MSTDLIGYLYAATVAAGGVLGYVKAGATMHLLYNDWKEITAYRVNDLLFFFSIVLGSIPSLAAGLAFGGILGKHWENIL